MLTSILAIFSGSLVGFTLGLIGGGGSILATPLLLYVVGMPDPHLAIGTGALAVSANAFMNFGSHARKRNVHWAAAGVFAAAGLCGALLGSTVGKAMDGQRLLLIFAAVMIVVGGLMLRPRRDLGDATCAMNRRCIARVSATGFVVGLASGFFGIGGGFLIVPGLVFATGMPLITAIGSSLFAVGVFGLATALNYAASGLVDWLVAAEYIAGGLIGGWLGMHAALHLAGQKNTLTRVFAGIIFAVAGYMIWRTTHAA